MRIKSYPAYENYKDTQIELLGEIPNHWEILRLKYLCSINDENLAEDTDPDYEISYVDIRSVNKFSGIKCKQLLRFKDAPSRARRIVRNGDIIISTVRTYLRAIASITNPEPNLIVSTGFAVVRPNDKLCSNFAQFLLRAPYFVERVVANSAGVSYPSIDSAKLVTLKVAIPPKKEQIAIGKFLKKELARIDELVEKKERQIKLTQEKRDAVINHVITKGLGSSVEFKETEIKWIGKIPMHWTVVPLRGVLRQRGEYNEGPRTTNILSVVKDKGVINYNERKASGNKKSENIEQYKIICKGDLVLNRMNVIIGSVGIAKENGAASIEYYVLFAKDSSVSTQYYGHIFSSKVFQKNLGRLGTGILSHRLRISFELLKM